MLNMDLHLHSNASDGTDLPEDVVKKAAACGVTLMALTDHDSIKGVKDASEMAGKEKISILSGVEMDAEFPEKMHILGIGMNIENPAFIQMIETAEKTRNERNILIIRQLRKMGFETEAYIKNDGNTVTRLHIAQALVDAGAVKTRKEAFQRYIGDGKPGYVKVERILPRDIIRIIRETGGVPILAHPCQMKANMQKLLPELYGYGLAGVEAYYPSATDGQIAEHCSIANQLGMLVTCGSDYHGGNRPEVVPGCAWKDVGMLIKSAEFFQRMHARN